MTQNTHIGTSSRRRIGFVVFDGMTMLDIAGPAEVFRYARQRGLDIQMPLIAATEGSITTASGLALAGAQRPESVGQLDVVIVAGGDELPRTFPQGLLEASREAISRSRQIGSVCTGAFVLAELGLLDGRRVTTHWRHAEALALRYPEIEMVSDAIFVRDGDLLTSAGVSAGIDLALAVVEEELGEEATLEIARELVVFMRRAGGESQFSAGLESMVPRDSQLHATMMEVRSDPALDHSVESMAARASVSPRHLARLFQEELGTSPHQWLQQIRLQRAATLLLQDRSVAESAQLSGLGNDETLRRVMARELGLTPREYVRRFVGR